MRVGVIRESRDGEHRVAAVPATVESLLGWGWDIHIESGAGFLAGFPDEDYEEAGATIVGRGEALAADLILLVGPPEISTVEGTSSGAAIVGFLDPFVDQSLGRALVAQRTTAIAMEAVPRITVAQSMDALSSQSNLAGYAAVLMAAQSSPRMLPMMVTAAGTIPPARVLILGVGVAGLQAIATARRLGAVVTAYDIRPETEEQVLSLGAKFVAAPSLEADAGGYAKEVGADVQQLQFEALAPHVAESDIVVTTAQIPGRPAPRLINAAMVTAMHAGSVIVDMAAGTGGNVEGSAPDEVVHLGGVSIFGPTNLASAVPADASRMYARNIVALLERGRTDDGFEFDLEDEVLGECIVIHDGEVRHPLSRELLGQEAGE